jgi:hypothetical protein
MAQRDDGGTVRGCGDTQVDASQSADRNVNEVLRAYFETFSTSYEVTPLGRFAGIGVLGKDARGNAAVARAYSVGDRIVFAWVSANGSHLNMPDAERFLNSLRLSVPWRVRALANVGVTVALPAFAAPTPPRAPQQGNVEFVLGSNTGWRRRPSMRPTRGRGTSFFVNMSTASREAAKLHRPYRSSKTGRQDGTFS